MLGFLLLRRHRLGDSARIRGEKPLVFEIGAGRVASEPQVGLGETLELPLTADFLNND